MVLYAALLLSAALLAALVYRHDLYDREPRGLLLLTAVAGALAMALAGRAEDATVYALAPLPDPWWIAAAAAFWEQAARVAVVGGLCLGARRWFNDPMDGLTYGSIAGLGMAAFESTIVLGLDPPLDGRLAAPEVVRQYLHLVLAGIAGFPFGMLRTGTRGARTAFLACTAAAAGIHFAVDWAGIRGAGLEEARALRVWVVLGATVLATAIYGSLAVAASEWSRRRFAPWSVRRLVDWPTRAIFGPPRDDSPG